MIDIRIDTDPDLAALIARHNDRLARAILAAMAALLSPEREQTGRPGSGTRPNVTHDAEVAINRRLIAIYRGEEEP